MRISDIIKAHQDDGECEYRSLSRHRWWDTSTLRADTGNKLYLEYYYQNNCKWPMTWIPGFFKLLDLA